MKPISLHKNCRERGSALLISLWALLMLAGAVFAWAKFIDQDITRMGESSSGLDARAGAHSGIAMALHPLVTPLSPLLEREMQPGVGYRVRMTGEGGKLRIDWLIEGENPKRLEILKSHLAKRGMTFEEIQVFVDSLLDYVDADNEKHLNGMEETPEYLPANHPLFSLDELKEVNGSKPLVSQAGWREDFTLYSRGPVDLLSASANIISILPGIGDARAQRFVQFRDGADKRNGTKDDYAFPKGKPEIMSHLGLSEAEQKQLDPFIAQQPDSTYFIQSTGFAGKVIRQVDVVARKGNATPAILLWNER